MSFLYVDSEKCAHDGICVAECPSRILFIKNSISLPEAVEDAEFKCIKCGHCVSVCPHGAITVSEIKPVDCIPIIKEKQPSFDHVEQLIKSRRSIRTYKNKNLEDEVISKIIDVARYAPTGGNSQKVQWLVVNSGDGVNKIASAVIDFMRILMKAGHPLIEKYNLQIIIDRWDSGIDVIFRGAPALIIAHSPKEYALSTIDCTIALSYFDIAASALGLGTCWAGFFMIAANQSPAISKILNLPEGNVCTGGLMLGYPKFAYHRIPPRKKPDITWMK
jgi:nitroreductase/ferredoxin